MTSRRLASVAVLLAVVGALLLVGAGSFLALLAWHLSLTIGYAETYVVLPTGLPIAFVACSVLVLSGSFVVRRRAEAPPVRRLAAAAAWLTVCAWGLCGVAWLVLDN